MKAGETVGPVGMLREWAEAIRGDWTIDGRQSRLALKEIAYWIEYSGAYPGDAAARRDMNLCPAGNGHWIEHCDDGCRNIDVGVGTGVGEADDPAKSEATFEEMDGDDEQYCPRCLAGVYSDEHHTRCVVTGYAPDGGPGPMAGDHDA